MNSSQPGSSVHGILQARILEWVAIPLGRKRKEAAGINWVEDKARDAAKQCKGETTEREREIAHPK